ncbi:MAG: hypothetical protein MRY74_02025 [Neomegalonema sp.]|nr:hypothetical protein [Neomegalonema sp.]
MAIRLLMVLAIVVAGGAGVSAQHAERGGPPLGEHTFLSFDGTHGVQIEFLDSKGRAYLWYPGEERIVPGRWWLKGAFQICFNYPTYVFKATPTEPAGVDICMSLSDYYETTISKRADDVFDLRSGRAPFVLSPKDYFGSFGAVLAARKAGR